VLTYLAYGLTALVGVGIIVAGARFFLQPHAAAAAFGVAVPGGRGATDAYFAVKGVRDIASGLVALVLMLTAPAHVIGWIMLTYTVIPLGDAAIVLRWGGSKALAFGMHGGTAVAMWVITVLLMLV
jgi:uncharacterized membrane protein